MQDWWVILYTLSTTTLNTHMKSQKGTSNIQNTWSQGTYEETIAPNKIEKNLWEV